MSIDTPTVAVAIEYGMSQRMCTRITPLNHLTIHPDFTISVIKRYKPHSIGLPASVNEIMQKSFNLSE